MPATAVIHSEDTEARLQKLLLEIEDIPSIPETLMEILKVLDDPDAGPSDLGKVVRMDAPLMARILRLANSPYYSRRGDIADISRCITVLGFRTVRQVAICVSVASSVIPAVAEAGGGLDYRELWRHSVVTGAIARHLAIMLGLPDQEEYFTAGLLHDMGKFVLEIHAPEKYWRVIAERAASGESLLDAENEAFGFDHAMLGAAFGQSWRFPELLVRCCGEHHRCVIGGGQGSDRAVAVISLADYLANTVEPTRSDLGFDPGICDPQGLHDSVGLEIAEVEENLGKMREDIGRAAAFLDLP